MALWKRFWLLFAVIWVALAALQAFLLLAVSDEPERALQPALYGIGVPAAVYLLGWCREKLVKKRAKKGSEQITGNDKT